MDAEHLKAAQKPLKDQYREDGNSAVKTLKATGAQAEGGMVDAGLHPAAGGDDEAACSGDMLLQSLVACSGVTLSAVSTAMGIPLESAEITAEGDLDFRGTLGVSKEVPIGFAAIRLRFDIKSKASDEQIATLQKLTERYCVIFQTIQQPMEIAVKTVRW